MDTVVPLCLWMTELLVTGQREAQRAGVANAAPAPSARLFWPATAELGCLGTWVPR